MTTDGSLHSGPEARARLARRKMREQRFRLCRIIEDHFHVNGACLFAHVDDIRRNSPYRALKSPVTQRVQRDHSRHPWTYRRGIDFIDGS